MKPTNIAILNRGEVLPDDGMYQVVPMGEFAVKHGGQRILQVIDARAVASMAQRYLDAGEKLLVDFDHFSYDTGQRSEAAGWIVSVEARTDGLWARIEWSDVGQPAIVNKRYRFISPVWMPDDCEDLGGDRLRPLRLDSVGLTNQPNLKGMQPLSNRGGGDGLPISHRSKETSMKKVLELLGLSADAAEDSAIAAVTALQNSAKEQGALLNRAEAAEAKVQAMEAVALEADAEAFCETHKDVIANRDAVKAQFIANRAVTEGLFAGFKAKAADADQGTSLKNRATKQPATEAATDAADMQKASAIRNRAHKIMSEQKVSFSVAFDRAKAEAQQD